MQAITRLCVVTCKGEMYCGTELLSRDVEIVVIAQRSSQN